MRYVLLFDSGREGFQDLAVLLIPIIGLTFGIFLTAVGRRWPTLFSAQMRPLGPLSVVFGGAMVLLMGFLTVPGYLRLVRALKNQQFEVVEGTVTEYAPVPRGGHGYGMLQVGNHGYRFSTSEYAAGFRGDSIHSVGLRQGVWVRIADVDGRIARLELSAMGYRDP